MATAQQTTRPKMAVGTWAWVFGPYAKQPLPLPEVARAVKEIGYDGVELTGKPHAHPEDFPTPESRRALTRMLAGEGLEVASLGGPVGGGSPFAVERTAYLGSVKRYVEFCTDAGITALRVSSGRPPESLPDPEAGFARLIDYWSVSAGVAAGAGIRLLWEFEPNQFASRPHDVRRVVDAIDRPNFQVMFDLSHAYVVSVAGKGLPEPGRPLKGGLAAFVHLLGRRIGRLHIADTAGETLPNGGSRRRRLGEGKIDFDATLAALREAGGGQIGDGWWTLDLHGEADATAVARESKAFMDALAARVAGR
ncbi:MAG: sugar phosphate isomerase/epimerase [Chloroflexi bacterium]|nr:sugar phosphate isomerase/epimerase [Chloroflexota bacterium]